eukprot:gnl/MRDRNA2_/MRDRNA2_175965_c0_seq1.p1 gnl/MRDRNA2_/MRDRNA2_175965_c0~~gnl/MRDRNA2_/MRDRNA2_175965_c0_seq1.p1  ORF type:complete len:379 (+),score=82.29 gnl/MRDRNA2_/MRDRNA2_175965_c0_seq1:215-1351(+)
MTTSSMKRRLRHHRLSFSNGYRAAIASQREQKEADTPPCKIEDNIDEMHDIPFMLDTTDLVRKLRELPPLFSYASSYAMSPGHDTHSNPCNAFPPQEEQPVETMQTVGASVETSQEVTCQAEDPSENTPTEALKEEIEKKEKNIADSSAADQVRLGQHPEADICVACHPSLFEAQANEAAASHVKGPGPEDLDEIKDFADEELLLNICKSTTNDEDISAFYLDLRWAFTPMVCKVIERDRSAIGEWLLPLCLELIDQMAFDRPSDLSAWADDLERTWETLQELASCPFCCLPTPCLEIVQQCIGLELASLEASPTSITHTSRQGMQKIALLNKAGTELMEHVRETKNVREAIDSAMQLVADNAIAHGASQIGNRVGMM